MTIRRMDHVGVAIDDLEAVSAFFAELGRELEATARRATWDNQNGPVRWNGRDRRQEE